MKNFKFDSKHISAGITALLVVVCCMVLFMVFQRWEGIKAAAIGLIGILSPFIWGAAIAYLLCPMMNFFHRHIFGPLSKELTDNEKTRFGIARSLSVLASLVVAIALVSSLVWLVVPRFYESIVSIVAVLPGFVRTANNHLVAMLEGYPEINSVVQGYIDQSYLYFNDLISNMQPQLISLFDTITSSLRLVVNLVFDLFVGIIVSCYLLFSKERFGAQFKRIVYSVMPVEMAELTFRNFAFVDRVLMGFLGGKLVDSAIIGVICYAGCVILKMPYALLIAVIIGVTNIIPYFGPFIGAIPCGFFILMLDPFKCLVFSVFIIALQQFDGNILGPHILGNSVGISGFWVMFSIIVGSGLFGFMGMLLGVPVFVVVSAALDHLVTTALKKRGLPLETADYTGIDHLDPETFEPVSKEEGVHLSAQENTSEEQ